MERVRERWRGVLLCFCIAVPCYFLGKVVPIIGGPVFAILGAMGLGTLLRSRGNRLEREQSGIKFTSKVILQAAVVLLGFGMNLGSVCLAAIGRYAPLSVNDLALAANLNKGQASRSAQALVERGLIEKKDSAADGRGVVLSLTPAGDAHYRRIIDLIARRNQEIFGCLSADEQRQLGDMLDRLIAHQRDPSGARED